MPDNKHYLDEIDRFKGILILLIVLGHNSFFSSYYSLASISLYNFHVASFLLLPFIVFAGSVSSLSFRDRATRYLVPHFIFFFTACLLYFFFYVPWEVESIKKWLLTVVLAILISSEDAYNTACGFRLFWFLPALLMLIILRSYFFSLCNGIRIAILVGLLFLHFVIGLIPASALPYMPYSLPLTLFIFPIGLLIGFLWKYENYRNLIYYLSTVIFVVCVWISISTGSYVALAGDPRVFSVLEPWQLLFHDVYLAAAFFGILGAAKYLNFRVLTVLGRYSLPVFLIHSFVWQFFSHAGLWEYLGNSHLSPALITTFSFVLTIMLSLGFSLVIYKYPFFCNLVFPRKWREWTPIARAYNT